MIYRIVSFTIIFIELNSARIILKYPLVIIYFGKLLKFAWKNEQNIEIMGCVLLFLLELCTCNLTQFTILVSVYLTLQTNLIEIRKPVGTVVGGLSVMVYGANRVQP